MQNWHDGLLSSLAARRDTEGGSGIGGVVFSRTEVGGDIRYIARTEGGAELGLAHVCAETSRLVLVNHGVGLRRKVLLPSLPTSLPCLPPSLMYSNPSSLPPSLLF